MATQSLTSALARFKTDASKSIGCAEEKQTGTRRSKAFYETKKPRKHFRGLREKDFAYSALAFFSALGFFSVFSAFAALGLASAGAAFSASGCLPRFSVWGFSSTGASATAAAGVVLSTRTFSVLFTSACRLNSTSYSPSARIGVFELDFFLVERDVELVLQFVGDHAGGDGAEQLAFLAGLDLDDADQLGNALGEFGHGVELMRLALGAALLERLDLALVRADVTGTARPCG